MEPAAGPTPRGRGRPLSVARDLAIVGPTPGPVYYLAQITAHSLHSEHRDLSPAQPHDVEHINSTNVLENQVLGK